MSLYIRIVKHIQDNYGDEDIMLADGLERALIGFTRDSPASRIRAIYNYDRCVTALLKNNPEWDHDDAIEWLEYNVIGAYVGDTTPLFVTPFEDDETRGTL